MQKWTLPRTVRVPTNFHTRARQSARCQRACAEGEEEGPREAHRVAKQHQASQGGDRGATAKG